MGDALSAPEQVAEALGSDLQGGALPANSLFRQRCQIASTQGTGDRGRAEGGGGFGLKVKGGVDAGRSGRAGSGRSGDGRARCDGSEGNQIAVHDGVPVTAPADGVVREAEDPDHGGQQVPEGNERELGPDTGLVQARGAHQEGEDAARQEVSPEVDASYGRRRHGGHGEQGPGQAQGEDEAGVSPGAQVAHDGNPAQALEEELAEGAVIGNGGDGVGEQDHFVAALGDEAADPEVVGRLVLDGGVAGELGEVGAGSADGRAEGEFDAVELPGSEDARVEVGQHTYLLETLNPTGFFFRNIEAGDGSGSGIGHGGDDAAEVVGLDAHIAVADDQVLVGGFFDEAGELGDLVVGGGAPGADDDANAGAGEIGLEALDDGQGGVAGVSHAKDDFVLGVVLAAEAGKVFVGFRVESQHRLEVADGR